MLKKIPHWLKNRFAITGLLFFIWLLFFDRNDLVSQFKISNELSKLEEEEKFFKGEITKDQEKLMELKTNYQTLEKFAREKYLMKKDNEEIFVIVKK
ncbi:MAG: septum formation initiator family protein [Bacteroidetes bacterium]|nr:septum formation initiator family protein [Bacteroidota bacterium]